MVKLQKMHDRVRTYIDDRCVSRKLIAINMGITESKLSLILNGKRRMTVDDYELICTAMAVDPRSFYSHTDQPA
ncbi:MAG: helix-turn-helix transcriptional regulator [Christensenellaceae bacterium]|nr:helix-turn-helix transcriptional regulator [Christensenellaceae bacterium]MEA5070255.1 helix-turn-helix transcriptional regulator [Christensenellaceae bacterium]